MKMLRRIAVFVVLPLAVAVVAGYIWYRTSETGKRWRYEDKLASYCAGLIPVAESAVFTGYSTDPGLPHDGRRGYGDETYYSCGVADLDISIGRVPVDAGTTPADEDSFLARLRPTSQDFVSTPLGGGWYGYTDLNSTGLVLACSDKPFSVVVAVDGDSSHADRRDVRQVAELAVGIGRKAADRWSCSFEDAGPVPPVAAQKQEAFPYAATGTCAGLGIPEGDRYVHWAKEAPASANTPVEECVLLRETWAGHEQLYALTAYFGPYAQARRALGGYPNLLDRPSGLTSHRAWATASCPGAPQAVVEISATAYAQRPNAVRFLVDTLSAFAERAVKRHGCTDLRLPSVG